MLGPVKFLGMFVLSVVGGNILNSFITFNDALVNKAMPSIAAGASGGIMGIGMALLIFALFKVRVGGFRLNTRVLFLIVGINLMYGFFVSGVDNVGHIGGAITGGLLALAFASVWKGNSMLQKCCYWLVFAIISVGFYMVWMSIHRQIVPYLS